MLIYTLKFDKRKAVFCVVMAALVLIGVILLVSAHHRRVSAESTGTAQITQPARVRNEKSRVAYLAANGWKVESPAESSGTVVIPRTFSSVFEEYNNLQKRQGFDLSRYCGMEVTMYTYRVTNPEYSEDEVLAVLYVLDGKVVGGDVHSTALDGFMVGVVK